MTSTTQAADMDQQAPAHGWWPLLVISSAQLMAILDTTVMFVALPSAQHAVGLSVADRQWIVTAYTLAFAALLLVGGRLADRLGARRTLLASVIGFALASAGGGASVTGAMLLTARAVQGASAALLVSSTKSLLVTVYTGDEERCRAIGIFTATNAAGGAIGLVLGGVLTTALSWRWCLYVNVAVSLVAIIGGPRVLPAVAGRREICEAQEDPEVHHIRKLADLNRPGRPERPAWMHLMAKRRRKTLVICRPCHENIHVGRAAAPVRK
jgi:MFS family permease